MENSNEFQCPYTGNLCDKLNTVTKQAACHCTQCDHYNKGKLCTQEPKAKKGVEVLKRFFTITTAVFEAQYVIANSFAGNYHKSYMHYLHLIAKEEVNKTNPDASKIDYLLQLMEKAANDNSNIVPKEAKHELNKLSIGFITTKIDSYKRFKENNCQHRVYIINDTMAFIGLSFDTIIKGDDWEKVSNDTIKTAYRRLKNS